MTSIETFLFEISKIFLLPVLLVLIAMFALSLFYFGMFVIEALQRGLGRRLPGPMARYAELHPQANQEALELHLLKIIEPLRVTSRVAPMLGLVATMIPMGPALIAVSSGNAQGVASNLVLAFSAVVVALLAAAITFTVLSVRRRWLLEELNELLDTHRAAAGRSSSSQPQTSGASHV